MTDKFLEEIREKISCPQFGDDHYGEWGILNVNQRRIIKRLIDYMDGRETYIKNQQAEIERLNNNIAAMAITLSNSAKATKTEAIKEFADEIHEEIEKALENNYKVKQERLAKLIALGITETDTLLQYIEGKIDCLRGLKWFIKEMVGEDQ